MHIHSYERLFMWAGKWALSVFKCEWLRELAELITRHNTWLSNTCLKVTENRIHHRKTKINCLRYKDTNVKEGGQTVWAHSYSVVLHSISISRSYFAELRTSCQIKVNVACELNFNPLLAPSYMTRDPTEVFWVCDVICGRVESAWLFIY